MGFYCSNECSENPLKESNFNYKNFFIIIGFIIAAIAILILGIFIGKKLYEVRKARANELQDEYEYKEESSEALKVDEKNIN